MPLPQSSLNPMCTYPDVLLYIHSFPCFRVVRILKRFVTRHERNDAPVSVVLCLPAHLCVSTAASRGQAPPGTRRKRLTAAGLPIPRVPLGATNPEQRGAAARSWQLAAQRSGPQRRPEHRPERPRKRRDCEGGAQTRTPTTASPIGRPARPHSQSRQPPPQPAADQHRPHSQSSATSPTSTTTAGPLHREHRR